MKIELASSKIEVGHAVIINDCDQPCGKLVAIVKSVDVNKVTALYLSKSVPMRECYSPPSVVTPVSLFGVRVVMNGEKYFCEVIGESTAKYPDGMPRPWREYGVPWCNHYPKLASLQIAIPLILDTASTPP